MMQEENLESALPTRYGNLDVVMIHAFHAIRVDDKAPLNRPEDPGSVETLVRSHPIDIVHV